MRRARATDSARSDVLVHVGLLGFDGNASPARATAARPGDLFAGDFDRWICDLMMRYPSLGFTVLCLLSSTSAGAADVRWRVVVSSSDSRIALPQLPDDHVPIGVGLADGGAGMLGFQLRPSGSSPVDGNWVERGSMLSQYAALGAAGALGPGRGGAESTHVFRRLYYGDSAGAGARAFGATANDPSQSAGDASSGLWLWNGGGNVEIARYGSEGALGPGIDGYVYKSFHHVDDTDNEFNVWMLPQRRVLFAGRIGATTATLGDDGLSVHTPGLGNRPCMLPGSAAPEFAPGVNSATFTGISALKSISRRGEVYALAGVRNSATGWSASGIWQFCDGAPRAAVLTGDVGDYGPGFPGGSAVFGGDSNGLRNYIAPSVAGGFYFSSGGRMSPASGAPTFFGLFHHDGTRNRPILLQNSEGQYGPQIAGYVFSNPTVPYDVKAAGRYAALKIAISPVGDGSSDYPGLWRIADDGSIEPVAVSGSISPYTPAPGRIWNGTFYRYAVFDDGDIVTLASTKDTADASTAISWWRLSPGAAPVEILKVGDLVDVPTPSGVVTKAVTAIDPIYSIALPPPAGRDTFFTADGAVITSDVKLRDFGTTTVVLRGQAARPDYIFTDGVD